MKIPLIQKKDKKKDKELENRMFKLVDFSSIKDFVTGTNSVLVSIKVKKYADTLARESLSGMKPERDWGKMLMVIFVGVIVAVVAFMLVTQFLDFSSCQKQVGELLAEVGGLKGQLAQGINAASGGSVINI